ncbi:MAG: hypothetical protein DDT18_01210 [Actinobacteria bacterium]|nr:hypothetical protein [Actinomycetota bacterium]
MKSSGVEVKNTGRLIFINVSENVIGIDTQADKVGSHVVRPLSGISILESAGVKDKAGIKAEGHIVINFYLLPKKIKKHLSSGRGPGINHIEVAELAVMVVVINIDDIFKLFHLLSTWGYSSQIGAVQDNENSCPDFR